MRLSHLIASAAAAFFAVGGSAMAATTVTSGNVDLHYAHSSFDPGNNDANTWGIGGAFATPLGDTWGVQLDGSWNDVNPDHGSDTNVVAGTAHLFHRTDTNLIGVDVGAIHNDDASTTTWGGGIEDDYYMDNTTLGARLLYLRNDDSDTNFWGLEGHARYFFQDNFKVEGSLGFGKVDFKPDNADVLEAGVNAEYQFASLPVSIFGGVNYLHEDISGNPHSTTASVGVRWNFGGQSLKDRDRSGASLAGVENAFGGLNGVF